MKRFAIAVVLALAINGAIALVTGLLSLLQANLYGGGALVLAGSLAWWAAVLIAFRIRSQKGQT